VSEILEKEATVADTAWVLISAVLAAAATSTEPTGIVGWASDIMDSMGLPGVAFLIALESIIPPIPSEAVLLLAGFNIEQGEFSFVPAVIAATIGSVIGALVLYALGRWLGEERMERLLTKVGKFVGLRRSDIDRANDWFERHGTWVILIGRLVPGVRSLVSIPAGANEMPIGRFVALTTVGSLIWNVIWVAIGQGLGSQWEKASRWSDLFGYAAAALFVAAVVYFIVQARRRRAASAA
jgi:membrane protein DedA with SNARE-associated domain